MAESTLALKSGPDLKRSADGWPICARCGEEVAAGSMVQMTSESGVLTRWEHGWRGDCGPVAPLLWDGDQA